MRKEKTGSSSMSRLTISKNGGGILFTAIVSYARPRMPSNLSVRGPRQSPCRSHAVLRYSLPKRESEAWLLGGLSKENIIHGEIADGELVARDKAFHGARTVLNGERSAVRLVCRRRRRVVLGVEEAGNGRALHTRNPEVARAVKGEVESGAHAKHAAAARVIRTPYRG
jgi:hypothetical protein